MPHTTEEFEFTASSLNYWDDVENALWQKIRALAKSRAKERGSLAVTAEDIRSCVKAAVEEFLQEQERRDDAPA